jgi:hypothetical protein
MNKTWLQDNWFKLFIAIVIAVVATFYLYNMTVRTQLAKDKFEYEQIKDKKPKKRDLF